MPTFFLNWALTCSFSVVIDQTFADNKIHVKVEVEFPKVGEEEKSNLEKWAACLLNEEPELIDVEEVLPISLEPNHLGTVRKVDSEPSKPKKMKRSKSKGCIIF